MGVGFSPIFFVLMVSTTAVQSNILKGPTNALRKVGDSVTLECVTSSNNCDGVEWRKMEGAQSPRTVYRDGEILNGYRDGRYSVSSTGGCSLTITQLKISDSGKFSCVLTMDASEVTKGSILVVISVRESCRSNVTNNELSQNDSYSFWTAINVPPKSVEPSNVTLSFPIIKTFYETETMDDKQPLIVRRTLTGIARKENITQRVCWASVSTNKFRAENFDNSTATLYLCTTQQLIVSYPVEKIAVSPSGPYYKEDRVRAVAKGHPFPTFKWTHLKSGNVVGGDTLLINGDVGDQYTCTATNTVKRRVTSQTMTIEVSAPLQPGSDNASIGSIGIGIGVGVGLMLLGGILFVVLWKRYEWCKRTKTDDKRTNGNEEDPARNRINRDDSHTSQYEPLNVLLSQNSDAEPTYEELTIPTEVDVTGQSVSSRAIREDKMNENEPSLAEYESLQEMELSPSDAYESIRPEKSNKSKKF